MKKRKITPTKLQKRAIAILKENPEREKNLGGVMREAGYKSSTSRTPGKNFLALKGTAVAIEKWREALRGSGLDEQRLLAKYNEWIDATKVKSSLTEPDKIVPDYETQLKVKDDIRRDLGLPTEKEPAQQVNVNLVQLIKKQKGEYGI